MEQELLSDVTIKFVPVLGKQIPEETYRIKRIEGRQPVNWDRNLFSIQNSDTEYTVYPYAHVLSINIKAVE